MRRLLWLWPTSLWSSCWRSTPSSQSEERDSLRDISTHACHRRMRTMPVFHLASLCKAAGYFLQVMQVLLL